MKRATLIFIVGPTAVGKTRIAVKLARRIHGEVISCDSMQIYRSMGILSQAPTRSEKSGVKHHLIGVLDPKREFNAAIFIEKALKFINDVIKRKKIPMLVGGSGLYVKALIDGLFHSPKVDLKFRKKLEALVLRHGSKRLHKKLFTIDPDTAKKIHPNDAKRIIRALEVYHSTGKRMSDIKKKTKGLEDRYDIKVFGFTKPRHELYSNINARVDKMFEDGVIEEVKKLKDRSLNRTAKAVLGFKEISEYLKGEYDLDRAKELLKRNTRRFAKRQLTWFRRDDRIKWFDLSKFTDEDAIKKLVEVVG